jgi:hypothetical protein
MLKTLSVSALPDELPTDWVKSDLLETIQKLLLWACLAPYRLG